MQTEIKGLRQPVLQTGSQPQEGAQPVLHELSQPQLGAAQPVLQPFPQELSQPQDGAAQPLPQPLPQALSQPQLGAAQPLPQALSHPQLGPQPVLQPLSQQVSQPLLNILPMRHRTFPSKEANGFLQGRRNVTCTPQVRPQLGSQQGVAQPVLHEDSQPQLGAAGAHPGVATATGSHFATAGWTCVAASIAAASIATAVASA